LARSQVVPSNALVTTTIRLRFDAVDCDYTSNDSRTAVQSKFASQRRSYYRLLVGNHIKQSWYGNKLLHFREALSMTLVTQPRVTVNPRAFIPDGTGGTENKIWTVRTIISVASHAIYLPLCYLHSYICYCVITLKLSFHRSLTLPVKIY